MGDIQSIGDFVRFVNKQIVESLVEKRKRRDLFFSEAQKGLLTPRKQNKTKQLVHSTSLREEGRFVIEDLPPFIRQGGLSASFSSHFPSLFIFLLT